MKTEQSKTSGKKNESKKIKPRKKWQTGEYDRQAAFKFLLPYQFLLLCKLMDTTPEQMITDFLYNLDCGSWKREGRDKAKEKLIEYCLELGYGQQHYTADDIREIFKEMDAIGMLFPHHAKMKLINLHAHWRKKYYNFWFKKWFRKTRRKQ